MGWKYSVFKRLNQKKRVAEYEEFCKPQRMAVPPAEITNTLQRNLKKPRLAMLDAFEMVAALDWLKKFIEQQGAK